MDKYTEPFLFCCLCFTSRGLLPRTNSNSKIAIASEGNTTLRILNRLQRTENFASWHSLSSVNNCRCSELLQVCVTCWLNSDCLLILLELNISQTAVCATGQETSSLIRVTLFKKNNNKKKMAANVPAMENLRDSSLALERCWCCSYWSASAKKNKTKKKKREQELFLTEDKYRREAWWFDPWLSYQLEALRAGQIFYTSHFGSANSSQQ